MSNEVSVFGATGAVDVSKLAAKAKANAAETQRGGGHNGSDYLNFSGKLGIYTIGADKREIKPDELWLLDVTSFEAGLGVLEGRLTKGKPHGEHLHSAPSSGA